MKKYFELFFTFFKIGLFTFGGGYAMIGVIENTCVEKKKWLTHDEMANVAVIAESTPGPIAINSATYIGNRMQGFFGAVAATLGVVLPSFIIILLISAGLDKFLVYPAVANAFKGIKVGVGILIFDAGINMAQKMKTGVLGKIIFCSVLIIVLITNLLSVKLSSVIIMLIAGCVSLMVFVIRERSKK